MYRLLVCILGLILLLQPCKAATDVDSIQKERYHLSYFHDDIEVDEKCLDNIVQIERIRKVLALSPRIDSIVVYAYSSPEGALGRNKWLAQKRAESAKAFILANLPNDSVVLPENIILHPMGEDWDGLYKELDSNYKLMNKDRVMKIMRADVPTETKKWRMQRLDDGFTYRWIIQHHMRKLRKATWFCVYAATQELTKDTTFVEKKAVLPVVEDTVPVAEQPEEAVTQIPEPADTAKARPSLIWSLKTNLLYDAALVPNLGAEFYLGKGFSISANWHYAWWNTKSWFWRTYGGELAVRKWLGSAASKRALTGHHVGVYAQLLSYDFMVGDRGYMSAHPGETLFERPNYAFGLEYGYSMPIAKRLNLDFVLGVGYHGGIYNEYLYMDEHYVWNATKKRSFFGPTKAEVTLVWLLGPVNKKGGSK